MGVIEVLSELHIKDYVLIEERTISFGEGLNVTPERREQESPS